MSDLKVNNATVTEVAAYGTYGAAGSNAAGADAAAGASLLPDPGLGHFADDGDVATMLALVLTKSAREDRDSARADERAAAEAAWQQGEAKVSDLREKADHVRAEGWTEGLTTIAEGACDVMAGTRGLDKAGDRAASVWHGAGEAFAGTGKVAGMEFKAQQVLDDARAEHDGNAKDCSERFEKAHHEAVQDARELIRKVTQWYSEMKKAKETTIQNAILRA